MQLQCFFDMDRLRILLSLHLFYMHCHMPILMPAGLCICQLECINLLKLYLHQFGLLYSLMQLQIQLPEAILLELFRPFLLCGKRIHYSSNHRFLQSGYPSGRSVHKLHFYLLLQLGLH